jgi:hypothetical protein
MSGKMDTLEIKATETTPEIKFDFDNNYFLFGGESYPEHSDEFYRPILESIQQYSKNETEDSASFVFKLTYFNSSSARVLMKLFELIDEMAENKEIIIEWHYHEDDDTMEEFGDDFSDDIENAKFKLMSYSDD